MAELLGPLLCAVFIGFLLLFFFVWLCFVRITNEIIDLKNGVGTIPDTVQKSTQGLASGLAKQAREKPPLPEDLDALTDVFIKMLQQDWVCSADSSVGLSYYQMAQYIAPYLRGGWRPEKYYDANTDHFWVRFAPPENQRGQLQQKQGGKQQNNQQQGKKQQQQSQGR